MSYVRETLNDPFSTQGGKNETVESIRRKDVVCAWLAGAFEGEGCVFAYFKKQTNPNCRDRMTLCIGASIYNTHPLFVEKVTSSLVELGVGFCCQTSERKNGDRPGIAVTIQGKGRITKLFNLLIPHLASKKKQAQTVLELIAHRESMAERNQDRKGVYRNMTLQDDEKIKELCALVSKEKHDFPSVLTFSRKPNIVFGKSSETLRSPLETIQ